MESQNEDLNDFRLVHAKVNCCKIAITRIEGFERYRLVTSTTIYRANILIRNDANASQKHRVRRAVLGFVVHAMIATTGGLYFWVCSEQRNRSTFAGSCDGCAAAN